MTKGLLISIFKNPMYAKCSNGGISETNDEALVIGPGIPGIFEAHELPVLKLESHVKGCARLVPVEKPKGRAGPMMGGTFGQTSDSRFSEAIEKLTGSRFYGAVPIHDRFE
jgi:hypothetical protein